MGRTRRHRQRQRHFRTLNVSQDPVFVQLQTWLSTNKFVNDPFLRAAVFSETGRGLQTCRNIAPGDLLVTVPLSLVISRSFAKNYFTTTGQYSSPQILSLSTQALLAFWLLKESKAGPRSSYYPYLQSLPKSYDNPFFCSPEEKLCLPDYLLSKVQEQENLFLRDYRRLLALEDVWSEREFSWAWFTVNTRAVYLDHDPRYEETQLIGQPSADRLALVPHLDLLNHSGGVTVKAGVTADGYQIVSLSAVQKYHQAFISYGPHDNTKLLVEYGFFLSNNPHESFSISLDDVCQFVQRSEVGCLDLDKRMKMIRDNGLDLKLCIVEDGFTWSLKTVLKLLTFKLEETSSKCSVLERAYIEEDDNQYYRLYLSFLSYLETKLAHEKMRMKNALENCSDQFVQCNNLVESHVQLLGQARTSFT